MQRFARLVYLVERSKKVVLAMNAQQAQEQRRQLAQQTSLPPVPGQQSGQAFGQVGSNPPSQLLSQVFFV